jgi:hypothetical protein
MRGPLGERFVGNETRCMGMLCKVALYCGSNIELSFQIVFRMEDSSGRYDAEGE